MSNFWVKVNSCDVVSNRIEVLFYGPEKKTLQNLMFVSHSQLEQRIVNVLDEKTYSDHRTKYEFHDGWTKLWLSHLHVLKTNFKLLYTWYMAFASVCSWHLKKPCSYEYLRIFMNIKNSQHSQTFRNIKAQSYELSLPSRYYRVSRYFSR